VAAPLLRTGPGRTAGLGSVTAPPGNVPAEQALIWFRALADATWFQDTLAAITSAAGQFRDVGPIAVPTTIAWGQHDRLLAPRQATRALAEFKSAHYVLLRGCGHVPMWDDPQQVAGVLLAGSSF
jgi:pimeloyl-ACP methyl ester carboxylesterase